MKRQNKSIMILSTPTNWLKGDAFICYSVGFSKSFWHYTFWSQNVNATFKTMTVWHREKVILDITARIISLELNQISSNVWCIFRSFDNQFRNTMTGILVQWKKPEKWRPELKVQSSSLKTRCPEPPLFGFTPVLRFLF